MIHLSEDGWKCLLTFVIVGAVTMGVIFCALWKGRKEWIASGRRELDLFASKMADEPDQSNEAKMRRNCGRSE